MRRRTYLAAATALTLAGCTGSGDPDDADDAENGSTTGALERDDDSGGTDGSDDGDDPDDDSGDADHDDGGDDDDGDEAHEDEEDGEDDAEGEDGGDDDDGDDDRDDGNEDSGEDTDPGEEGDAGDDEDGAETDDENAGEPIEPGTFEDFADLSRWAVLEGSLEPTNRAYAGEQAARLESGIQEDRVTIAYVFDEPRDLRAVVPGIAVASEEMVVPTIQLVDEGGDRIDYRRAVTGGLSFMRYNFGEERVVGEPDLGRVTELRITLWTGQDEQRAFRCDDLHFTPRPETGKVMIQFDDTHDTDYTEGFRILEEHGYPAVTFVNPDRVGEEGWLSMEQLEELSAAGWTVGNHTLGHPDLADLDRDEQEEAIVGAADWLAEHGFEGARYFAYPFGQFDEDTLEIVAETHALGFSGGYPVQGHAVNPVLCSRIGDPEADRAVEALERTAEVGGITCLFYHRLEDGPLEDFEAMVERLSELESAGDLEVITPRALETELQFRD